MSRQQDNERLAAFRDKQQPSNGSYEVNFNAIEKKTDKVGRISQTQRQVGKLDYSRVGIKLGKQTKKQAPNLFARQKTHHFVSPGYKGDTDHICERLSSIVRPIYGTNFSNFLAFDTVFTSDTHYMIENQFASPDFAGDSALVPRRAQLRRYSLEKNPPRE